MMNADHSAVMLAMSADRPQSRENPSPAGTPRVSFWSRNSTIINFWLDALLLVLFVVQAWMFAVLHAVFPRGAGPDWTIWNATPLDWSEALLATFGMFSAGVVLHLMLHWSWICGVVSTRILGRKPGKDDGSQTLIGVGLIVVVLHLLAAGILAARMSLAGPQ